MKYIEAIRVEPPNKGLQRTGPLRGPYRPPRYERVMLPVNKLRRSDFAAPASSTNPHFGLDCKRHQRGKTPR